MTHHDHHVNAISLEAVPTSLPRQVFDIERLRLCFGVIKDIATRLRHLRRCWRLSSAWGHLRHMPE